jgi:uncharacterized lipoprotein YddW (UPF0748 family)
MKNRRKTEAAAKVREGFSSKSKISYFEFARTSATTFNNAISNLMFKTKLKRENSSMNIWGCKRAAPSKGRSVPRSGTVNLAAKCRGIRRTCHPSFEFRAFTKNFLLASCLLLLASCSSTQAKQTPVLPIELRGVWLTNVDSRVLENRASIAEAMQFLADHNFNIVYPVVWNKAMTQYRSDVMKQYFGIEIDTLAAYKGRDPLAEVIEEAHKRNIAVVPWFEFGFSSSYNDNGGHILKAKPHWAARDREGKLLKKNGFEWMNAFHPEVQEFMLSLVTEVVKKYNVDGVQGDDRLPAQPIEGGYDSLTVALYKETHAGNEPPLDFSENHWKYWRAVRLNAFAQTLYRKVKALKPDVVVTWSPSIYPWSLDEYLQDWRS